MLHILDMSWDTQCSQKFGERRGWGQAYVKILASPFFLTVGCVAHLHDFLFLRTPLGHICLYNCIYSREIDNHFPIIIRLDG